MFIKEITEAFYSITWKHVLCAALCVAILSFLYVTFVYEGFSNEDGCMLSTTGHTIAVKTIDELNKIDVNDSRDQINVGYNLRNMQTRDIILGDESKTWCKSLNEESLNKVLKSVADIEGSDVYLFDGPELMDDEEKKSNEEGITYHGSNMFDDKYAKV